VRAAVAFLESAFGFRERVWIGEDHRAQMQVADPRGHRWELTQSVRDVDPVEWGGVGSW
jgi:uncharacterized glyoxalase superfamily protein PhnB